MKLKTKILYPNEKRVINELIKHKEPIVLLVGTCLYNNIGDHLISKVEKNFIQDNYQNYKIYEIPTPIYEKNRSIIKACIKKDDIIFITGGGWMGSVWEKDELIMQGFINDLHTSHIIILPQTIYYEDNYQANKVLDSAKKTYSRCQNLTICLRDYKSYLFARENFSMAKIYLLPDIALYDCDKKIETAENKKANIGICLRKDAESLNNDILDFLNNNENLKNEKKVFTSTLTKLNSVPIFLRNFIINKKIKEFSKYKIVVTDRLHAMIISKLAGTVCYVLDNCTGKVKGVYDLWLKDDPNIHLIEDGSTLSNIKCVNYQDTVNYISIKKKFEVLK